MNNLSRISYQKALNPSQLEAVRFTEGPLLVIAGAGSGKTRTLTYRVARLVENGVPPGSILLLTFTRKASSEMLKRAALLLDHRCEQVAGGTFHSFANSVLRRFSSRVGFQKGFSILDRTDSQNLIEMLKKEIIPASDQRTFPRKQTLASLFSRAVNKVLPVDDVLFDDYPQFTPHLQRILRLNLAYIKYKSEHSLCDYDDLLIYLKMLLKDHSEIRNRLSDTYQFLMVDEYQDTNQIQADIIRLLAGSHANVMVVGDDSQSIYAFRGANFKNIMNFPKIFPGTRIVTLEENYRSVQPILDLTNIIISRAAEKYSKILFSKRTGNSRPLLVKTRNENRQSKFIVSRILDLHRDGLFLNQMAVLFRAGFHSFDLEIELNRHQIPFIKVGGFKFSESAHIKDVLAHLKVLSHPYDRLSWIRILLLLDRIGPKSALNIFNAILAEQSGYTAIFTIKIKKTISNALERLKALFAEIETTSMSLVQMGEAVFNYYAPILKAKYDDFPKRTRDLEHLLTIMERYSHIDSFLTDMALEPPNTSVDDSLSNHDPQEDRLTLSTIHSAKGLEWHTVFIIWALDGRFPSSYTLHSPEDLEEELRLMYVAATRARDLLFFTYPMQGFDWSSGTTFTRPSRFIDNIPGNILEKYPTIF